MFGMCAKSILAAGAAIAVLAVSVPAGAATLTNGTDDGDVSVTVLGAGAFGSATDGGDAFYNPVGATPLAGTTFESFVYLRVGNAGTRTNISTLDATVTGQSATSLSSMFSASGLDFSLIQTLSDLVNGSDQTGSLLTQEYSITNTTGGTLTFELVRYLDGDLQFDGSITDGGGRLFLDTREVLFETDTAIGSASSNTFVGVYNEGGASIGYEVASFSGLRSRIAGGIGLANSVSGDGGDADQFIDAGNGYDVTLGLGRSFILGAGQTTVFTTATLFGSGAPEEVQLPPVPEPATWAMMILGFGLVGAMRRQSIRTARIALA